MSLNARPTTASVLIEFYKALIAGGIPDVLAESLTRDVLPAAVGSGLVVVLDV